MNAARWLGAATVRGRLYSLGWYPGLILDAGAGEVRGDVFELTGSAQLAALDIYEGCHATQAGPHEYQRVGAEVAMDGETLTAWVWVWQPPANAARVRIATSDWLGALPLGGRPTGVDEALAAS
jgi:gamma-glutamylcyclotransferase (GGCT)/AIG2-like uncharacterized protein YtfP